MTFDETSPANATQQHALHMQQRNDDDDAVVGGRAAAAMEMMRMNMARDMPLSIWVTCDV